MAQKLNISRDLVDGLVAQTNWRSCNGAGPKDRTTSGPELPLDRGVYSTCADVHDRSTWSWPQPEV